MAKDGKERHLGKKRTWAFWKTFILCFLLMEIAIALIFLRSIGVHRQARRRLLIQQQQTVVDLHSHRIGNAITLAIDDARLLAQTPVLETAINHPSEFNQKNVQAFLLDYLTHRPDFIRTSILNRRGGLLASVVRSGTGDVLPYQKSSGLPDHLSLNALLELEQGLTCLSTSVSRIPQPAVGSELSLLERATRGLQPVLHVAQPTFRQNGEPTGLIIIEYRPEFSQQTTQSKLKPRLVLLNRQGSPFNGRSYPDLAKGGAAVVRQSVTIPRSRIYAADTSGKLTPLSVRHPVAKGPVVAAFLPSDQVIRYLRKVNSSDYETLLILTLVNLIIAYILGHNQDRQARTRQAMEDEKERFRSLYQGVSDAVLVCQLKPGGHLGRFIEVNEVACRQYGYSVAEFSSMTLRDITVLDCDPELWRRHLDSGEPFQQRRQTRDSKVVWVEARAHRLKYESTPAIIFLEHDVTRLRASMDQFEEAKVQAESANQAKSAFLANMSHEIRTPMNAILGYTQLLRRDRTLNMTAREHLEIIHRSGEHLLALINDILELSKIEAGRIQINQEMFDMPRLMTDLERMFLLRVKQKGLCFALESSWDIDGSILGDQGKVRQILINILGNAVKFTENGGIIARYGAEKPPIRSGKLNIWVEVEDTGRGIASDEIAKVFRPFEQAESGISEGGTGLGMAISREYARIMGGEITVKSTLGVGSTFRLEFKADPAMDAIEDSLDHTTIIRLLIDREIRILVVDDREHNRSLLKTLLENNGFKVITANDGLDAVETFKRETPNLVLMDQKMPAMNGHEAGLHIRMLPGGRDVPMFLVTASAATVDIAEDVDEVFQSVIRKPFKDTEVLSAIRDALNLDYRYEYEPKLSSSIFTTTQMRVSSRIIPAEMREAMMEAIRTGDLDEFSQLTEQLAQEHPLMAARLKNYFDDFDYEKLTMILEDQEDEH